MSGEGDEQSRECGFEKRMIQRMTRQRSRAGNDGEW